MNYHRRALKIIFFRLSQHTQTKQIIFSLSFLSIIPSHSIVNHLQIYQFILATPGSRSNFKACLLEAAQNKTQFC
jgi:hypothetical protein